MKKIFVTLIFLLIFIFVSSIGFLSTVGYETDNFNSLLEKKITSNFPNSKIELKKIKVKIDLKNLGFFITTSKPKIFYFDNNIYLKKINAYIDFRSILVGKPKINTVNIASNDIEVKKIKNIIKYIKPSNFKQFFLNKVDKGKINFNLDLNLKNNQITDYEINGFVKNFYTKFRNINFENASFIYVIKENGGEIDNIRTFVNGFQINSGNIKYENKDSLKINGKINSELYLSKDHLKNLFKNKTLENFKNLEVNGKIQSLFYISFDKTLKLVDYKIEANGNLSKTNIKFSKPQKYLFLKNRIDVLNIDKANFKINYLKNNKKKIDVSGSYKINDGLYQKFEFLQTFGVKSQIISINANVANDVIIPMLNFKTQKKVININTNLEIEEKNINLRKFTLLEGKSRIDIKNLIIKNKKFIKLDKVSAKTFNNGKLNNDFTINYGKKIIISGFKYDASNLTKLLERKDNSNFLNDISKEINVKVKEVLTNQSDVLSNFNLIGFIKNGKFVKITSKGEFSDGKYLDISLKNDEISKKKILEIYSDLPKTLLSNYKFFNGLSGGQLLFLSTYDDQKSELNLIIENFKVKDAPSLVKLLSLADFGGLVDALSGDGLSFEKLEMKMEKNEQVLILKELYAIGPSISILMDGYIESKTGLISLRGTMVPAKALNKFLSKLPIVGEILIPKEIGEGLFGISFKMKGVEENLKTTVNPIKTLTPRFIQKALKKSK